VPGEELCANCGTPLMLIVVPPAARKEQIWADNAFPAEHLLERVSLLEMRLMQVTDRLSQALELMLKQSRTVQAEHLLLETLLGALTAAGVLEDGKISEIYHTKKRAEESQISQEIRREQTQNKILAAAASITRLDLFTNLVKNGFRLISRGDEKQGIHTLERAAALDAKNARLFEFIGEYYFRQEKREAAREFLTKAHRFAAHNPRVNLLLGVILIDAGEFAAAKKILDNRTTIESGKFAANFLIGMIYAAKGDFSETLRRFKCALANQTCAETHYLVGSAYFELERDRTALKHFQKAVEADADFADAWFMAAAAHARLGNETEAKNALKRAASARDAGARARAFLRKSQKELAETKFGLLFAKLTTPAKNLISSATPPRLVKLLYAEIFKSGAE
jgi:predicted Zn-dependent protease